MNNTRRSFLKGSAVAAVFAALPFKGLARLLVPTPVASPLFVSISSLRPGWVPMCLRLATRLNGIRTATVAAGAAAGAALRAAFKMGGRAVWFDHRFRPSLRSIVSGTVR